MHDEACAVFSKRAPPAAMWCPGDFKLLSLSQTTIDHPIPSAFPCPIPPCSTGYRTPMSSAPIHPHANNQAGSLTA